MSIYANDAQGDAAVAGQVDLLMKDAEGGLHIVDFKRTPGDLAPEACCYGKRFLNDLPLNDHHKYSLQLQLYAIMLELQTGHRVRSMRLMQVHPDLDAARLIETTDMREHAIDLLRSVGVEV
jgi:ATP-dependent exoDNAse (exonuclease V) beta subunit